MHTTVTLQNVMAFVEVTVFCSSLFELVVEIKLSSLRLHRVLRCLGGDVWVGFGELGGGLSSALVGWDYGW